MRYCHHCGAEVGPHAEVCDECDGDLFEPPADLGVDEETNAEAADVDAEVADVDGAETADADADGAAATDADDPDAEAVDAATGADAAEAEGAAADASAEEQGLVAKIKGLFQ